MSDLNRDHLAVLNALDTLTRPHGEMCVGFVPMMECVEMERAEIRRLVRFLARRGHAEFHRGLMTEEGELAGAGYCITPEGICDLTGEAP